MGTIEKLGTNNLFIFELANNHSGDVDHGLKIINSIAEVVKGFDFTFGFKLQYRNLDTFIHPEYKTRDDVKYIKRFSQARLSDDFLKILCEEIKKLGFISVCTPFDEQSVDLIEKHGFDLIKIASCSLTDWPLLERIAKTKYSVIASTAGVSLDDIDKVVLFLEHRSKDFALMHCVGEYPTSDENLRLDRIDLLKKRYPAIPIGFSTHEKPDNYNSIQIAIAKGANIFEKHVGISTQKYTLNEYSAKPEEVKLWLESARKAFSMCGKMLVQDEYSLKERTELRKLQRGVFAKKDIICGEKIGSANVFFAIPNVEHQILANDLSKYTEFIAQKNIRFNQPILQSDISVKNLRSRIIEIMKQIREILLKSKVTLPNRLEFELSHHQGIDNFEKYGAAVINCINREYCKKLIILLPGQKHPIHYHVKKEETFNVLYGDVTIWIEGEERIYNPGDMVVIERKQKHGFSSSEGAIFEEISTTHYVDDSFYEDSQIELNKDRKTFLTVWLDWLMKLLP